MGVLSVRGNGFEPDTCLFFCAVLFRVQKFFTHRREIFLHVSF